MSKNKVTIPRDQDKTLTQRAQRNVRDHKGSKTTTCEKPVCTFPFCMC